MSAFYFGCIYLCSCLSIPSPALRQINPCISRTPRMAGSAICE
jgi:hypothetical protein